MSRSKTWWNYRVIAWRDGAGYYFSVHECLYDQRDTAIPHSWTKEGVRVIGDTTEEIRKSLTMMRLAFQKPTLIIRRNKAYVFEGRK